MRHITARCLGVFVHARRVALEHGGGITDVITVYDDVASAMRRLPTPAVARPLA